MSSDWAANPDSTEAYVICTSAGTVKELMEHWAKNGLAEFWELAAAMRHTRVLFRGPSKKLGTALLNLDRRQPRLVVGLITEYFLIGKHMRQLGIRN